MTTACACCAAIMFIFQNGVLFATQEHTDQAACKTAQRVIINNTEPRLRSQWKIVCENK